MAHANPDFALGLMRHEPSPVRFQTEPPASLNALRRKLRAISELPAAERTPDQQRALDLWQATVAIERRMDARELQFFEQRTEGKAMHGATRRGERFSEPKRRIPLNVQAGRVKLDCRGLPVE